MKENENVGVRIAKILAGFSSALAEFIKKHNAVIDVQKITDMLIYIEKMENKYYALTMNGIEIYVEENGEWLIFKSIHNPRHG